MIGFVLFVEMCVGKGVGWGGGSVGWERGRLEGEKGVSFYPLT